MAWVTPTNVSTGDVLTASTWNQAVVENTRVLRGDWAQARRTSGNFTINAASWTNLDTGMDLTLAAAAGDIVEVGISGLVQAAGADLYLDVVTVVGGTAVNSLGRNAAAASGTNGIVGWRGTAGVFTTIGSPYWYKLVAGDVSGGNVVLRIRYYTSSAINATLWADTSIPLVFTARNHGAVEV
jgi:hypothetical protein